MTCHRPHPGVHTPPNRCPECGKFSLDSWVETDAYSENGWNEFYGGICAIHGEWSDSAA